MPGFELDVLVHVLHVNGELMTAVDTLALQPGTLLGLPRLSRREFRLTSNA